MAEARSTRMQIVQTLAERHENTAAQRLSQYREMVTAEQGQLRQLEEYSAQYMNSYAGLKSGLRAQDLMSYSSFIQRLGEAIADQQQKIKLLLVNLEKLQEDWRTKHQKRKSIEELISRLKHEENQVLEKRLQKELDELSSQQFQQR